MKRKAKIIIIGATILFFLTLANAPWQSYDYQHHPSYTSTAPIWDPPWNATLIISTLFVEWAAIGIGTFLLLMVSSVTTRKG